MAAALISASSLRPFSYEEIAQAAGFYLEEPAGAQRIFIDLAGLIGQ